MKRGKGRGRGTDVGPQTPARRRKALRGVVRVVAGEAWATLGAGWDGSVRVALVVVNFGRRDLKLDQVRLRHVRIGPTHVGDPRPLAEEGRLTLPGRTATRVFLDLRLSADDIARLRRGFEPAANRSSSPKVDMECSGELVVRRRIRAHDEPFLLEHLAVVWTVAEETRGDETGG